MIVRPYKRSDAKDLVSLIRALARYEKLKPLSPSGARRLVADVGRRFQALIAEEGGRAVGYAIYFFNYSTFLARPTLYLEDIFVLPEQRRGGIGARFFAELRKIARREGCGRMEWMVLDWNTPAHRFYRKLGAKTVDGWLLYRLLL
jgi:GNAT superfamily N-acetyltransferase